MPDFAMCPGGECPMKSECWRHRAEPGVRQAYFVEPPFRMNDDANTAKCDHHIPMRKL